MAREWEPIASNTAASGDAIDQIAAELARFHPPLTPPGRDAFDEAAVEWGLAGSALFFMYRALDTGNNADAALAIEALQAVVGSVSERVARPALYGGLSGIAWLVEHANGRIIDVDVPPNEQIDDSLLSLLRDREQTLLFDFISGLAGIGTYALSRDGAAARSCVEEIILRLDETKHMTADGICWMTRPEWLDNARRLRNPSGTLDLGLAHGIPGVIAFLAQAVEAGIMVEVALPLLGRSIDWLLAQRIAGPDGPTLPAFAEPGARQARVAWCYGDLGASAALAIAGTSCDNQQWLSVAIEMALGASNRAPEHSGVVDAGLCHGSAGVAHIFNRFFQWTGDERFRVAALDWVDWTLSSRSTGEGLAGFRTRWVEPDDSVVWLADPGLLTGIAGIGLALLATQSSVEPEWDSYLLLSPARVS